MYIVKRKSDGRYRRKNEAYWNKDRDWTNNIDIARVYTNIGHIKTSVYPFIFVWGNGSTNEPCCRKYRPICEHYNTAREAHWKKFPELYEVIEITFTPVAQR